MALNFDSSLDEIEKIIPSPKINTKNIKDLFSECEESKSNIDSKINNIDSFGDISQINNVEENSSLLNNNKNSKLPSTNENTENSKKIKYNEEYNFKNIKSNRINNNNDTKYKILFDENKKMNLNSLREEYNKIKKDNNHNNYNKRYINIFNDNKQKMGSNLFLNLDNKKQKQNRNITLYTNNDLDEANFKFNVKTNHNSKQKETNDKGIFKSQLFQEKNRNIWENKYKKFKYLNNINFNYSKIQTNNITKENKKKKFYIYEEYKSNSSKNEFQYNKNNNKNNLFNRYNKFSKDLKSNEKESNEINPIKSFNKISESNKIEKLDNDFNAIFNIVERKIRQNKIDIKINEANQRYYNKNNKFNKLIPKLLSISQNEPMNNYLYNYSNRNNMFNNNFKCLYRNNLFTQINQEVMRPYIKDNKALFNNYIISDFSINQNN
jgi:hypothetical protein